MSINARMIDSLTLWHEEEPQAQCLWTEGGKQVIVTDLKTFGPSCLLGKQYVFGFQRKWF